MIPIEIPPIPHIVEVLLTPSLLLLAMLGCLLGRRKRMKSLRYHQQIAERMGAALNEMRRMNDTLMKILRKDGNDSAWNQQTDSNRSPTKLYVGNIDYTATEAELGNLFSKFGRIESVNIPINRYNGKPRGFGFVSFHSARDAEKAMALNGSEFKGRALQVNFAKEQAEDEI